MMRFVLNQVDRFDNVDVVQCRGDTELRGELLDVVFLRLVLSPFPEFLKADISMRRNSELELTLTAYSFSSLRSHLCASRTTAVAPFPIAALSQTPYFFSRLAVD
jgi:hypothetical protein